jgi:cell wall-associated NlpC family hydrolase
LRLRTEQILLVVVILGAPRLEAQGRDIDLLYGRWYRGNQTTTYELRTTTPFAGPFGHGLAAYALVHDSLGRQRAFYGAGWELQAFRHRRTLGPYALLGVALGLSTDTSRQELAALWDVGGGVEWRPISWLAVGVEGRYRLQDVGPRGFWSSGTGRREGLSAAIGASLGIGKREWRGGVGNATRASRPALSAPRTITGTAADVVRTALDALGTPYEWGGSAENGFDCSGLIQYAYARHGFRLPRMSRDQVNSGSIVTPVLDALQPGDILLFAAQPGGGVTHVGMYVGEQTFIHSSNTGVRLSRLEAQDPDGAWWVARWVGVRRIVE